MILITSYYKTKDSDRQKELDECLKKNAENKYITKIYLLNDKTYDLDFIENKNKIKQFSLIKDNKLFFKDAIEFINSYCFKDLVILSNSDIYFDDSLINVEEKNLDNKVYALLRYNVNPDESKDIFRHFDEPRPDSQDSWIFKSPLNIDLNMLNFTFGTLGCDNMFASVIYDFGYQIENPAYSIIIYHLHNVEERNYTCEDRIHGKYCLIYPHHLGENPKITFMDY